MEIEETSEAVVEEAEAVEVVEEAAEAVEAVVGIAEEEDLEAEVDSGEAPSADGAEALIIREDIMMATVNTSVE